MTKELCPKGWAVKPLKKIAEIQRKSVSAAKIKSGTMYVGLEHIDGSGSFINPATVVNGELASSKFIFGPDHLLYGKLRPYLKKIVRPSFSGVCSTDILPILPDKGVLDRSFLYYYLRQTTLINLATARATGANLPRLSPKTLSEFPVLFPPLAEQKRIAAILDKADAIRRKRQDAIALADTFLRSVFLKMFGDPVTNPMGWDEATINDVATVQGGLSLFSKRKEYPIERPYLRVANVFRDYLDLEEIKTIRVTEKECEKALLIAGDVLIVEGHGNKNEIGRCAVWDGSIKDCLHQNHLIRVRVSEEATPEYLSYYINSPGGRIQMLRSGRTTSGLNTISISKVKSTKLFVPPIDLQEDFSEICHEFATKTCRKLQLLNSESNNLFSSLQQRAFRGDL